MQPTGARRAFWIAQLGGWFAYALVHYLSYMPALAPGEYLEYLGHRGLLATEMLYIPLGIAASTVLGVVYGRLFARRISWFAMALVAVFGCAVLGAGFFLGHRALQLWFNLLTPGEPLLPGPTAARSVLAFTFALLAWSGAWFGVVLRQASQASQLMAQEARLRMLAYQLNPHFLFNTLNSLRAMIGEDPTRARRMVTELAEFLRYALVHHPLVVHWQHPASVEDYLQEFGRAGRDGRVSVAVVFIGEKDEGLLRFMAEKTVEGARIGPSSKKEVLKAKYHAIGEMRRVATSSSACFRNVIVRYFEESPSPHRRPLAVRIVDWLFSRSVTPRRTQFCCDRCDQVGVDNVIAWAAQVFGQTR